MNTQKSPEHNDPFIVIASPRGSGGGTSGTGNADGDTVAAHGGLVVGRYDLGGGTLDKIECQFMNPGTTTPAEDAFPGTVLSSARKVWKATVESGLDGPFDLVARLYLTPSSTPPVEFTAPRVIVRQSPQVAITLPVSGDDTLNAALVNVQVDLVNTHTFTNLTRETVNGVTNVSEHPFPYPGVSLMELGGVVTQAKFTVSGSQADHRRIHVTVDGGGQTVTLSVGELKLS
jgi:hypothetical protein